MKIFWFRISLFLALLFLVTNCSSTKTKSHAVKSVALGNAGIAEEEEIYIPHLKSERKNFFPDTDAETRWVDSIYNQLSFEEKVGQLFMVAAYSNKDAAHIAEIEKLVSEYKVGGLIFFQGGPNRQAKLTNRYQAKAKVPLFIGIDAEWGLSMRLDSTYRYPFNMTLGAIQDLKLIEKVGENMAKESKRMGVHFNFAPVLDINTNPKNPIIGFRSFGENKVNVTEKAIALMQGVQSQGVFSTGKHFPGHGDTATDSHYTLPTINATKEHLDKVELYPYKRMIDEGMVSVMVAHLNVPSLEFRDGHPSSLSYNVVTNLLKQEMGFDGLIFTDALNMKGASNFKKPGEIDLEALLAGNDVLLFAENVPVAVEKICMAYQDSLLSEERLAYSVKKILRYKFKAGLNNYKPIDLTNLSKDLNAIPKDALQYELYENIVTVLKNEHEIVPIEKLDQKIAYVKMGDDTNTTFVNTLKKYTEVTEVADTNIDSLKKQLKGYDKVIIGFHKSDRAWKKHDFTETELLWIQEIAKQNKVILDVFTRPYSLLQITNFDQIETVIVSYQNNDVSQEVSAQIIFGALSAKGKLPVSINNFFKVEDGLETSKSNRLGFTVPENIGMSSEKLAQIDKIAQKAIDGKMAPGMQVLVARKGKVIYQKSFGYQTYDKQTKVNNDDLYDVASLTKMIATLPNVMQQFDNGKVTLETTLGDMLHQFRKSNKSEITFKELMSHYSRLQAWIPFYKATLDVKNQPLEKYYRKTYTEGFTKQVAENLYIRDDYHDTIMKKIVESNLIDNKEYKYSDFTFIILKKYLEKTTGKSLDELTYKNFYKPLGMNNTMYNPLLKFDCGKIAPTEVDTYFRHTFLQGYVHDMEAAMEGGIGGHAGIFSNAMDVAKMMQLFLQKGNYGGITYFSPETFDVFNTCFYCAEGNRRGLGFDKPQLEKTGPTCGCVSKSSFGHTGFTGTMAWADPETEIVYVFLSNRTFPDSNASNKLSKEKIREDIQKIIQEAIVE
ncbi:MAG: serine hydrolase [Flavobacterium sp.]|uniref:glycoside hydrolase family 3 N-terminal domain-containing protein n=1 Tax=Flavobacterium sp. TaxID=239 RepID=UPI0022BE07DF|nr:glycoside hydrolase family 3 N-terminal domain-containing protein [Flavobacterium sp.]MCZ8329797.1 serine hydrolase [Flavobacterium sp.]